MHTFLLLILAFVCFRIARGWRFYSMANMTIPQIYRGYRTGAIRHEALSWPNRVTELAGWLLLGLSFWLQFFR
jgi:hypothetical protein